jgi:peptidoglycan/xylan/chitin deacetylase (PgdA/CDA1 family)
MQKFGVSKADARYFLPPFEWYSETVANWATGAGVQLINFTPGTSSNADYTSPGDPNYLGSDAIIERIKRHEASDRNGLNGFILLSHIGAGPQRSDKFFDKLDSLLVWLRSKNYELVRVDDLLKQ